LAREVLGWAPRTTPEVGIPAFVAAIRDGTAL